MLTPTRAWEVLQGLPDPEIPVVSICELGIVRDLHSDADGVTVVVTPTYSGCPATEAIEASIREALLEAGARRVQIETRLSPAWTTDWLAPQAAEKLRAYGIAPPGRTAPQGPRPVQFVSRIACPHCGSKRSERLSEFGSTACKAMYRCLDCREPFEYFKPL